MDVLEKLKPLCSTDETRTSINTPWGAVLEGQKWAWATNGHAAVALHFDGELRTDGPNIAAIIPKIAPTHKTSLAQLRKWVGAKKFKTCDGCEGIGSHRHRCNCEYCAFEGKEQCPVCSGSGKILLPRLGLLLSAALNRDLLADVLSTVPEGCTEIQIQNAGEKEQYVFTASGWIGVQMPVGGGPFPAENRFTALIEIRSDHQEAR